MSMWGRVRCISRSIAVCTLSILSIPTRSNERTLPRFEIYQGVDYWGSGLASYSSFVWGIDGPVTEDGFRLNVGGSANVFGDGHAGIFTNAFALRNTSGIVEMLAGYQLHRGPVWMKFYAGGLYETGTKALAGTSQNAAGWSAKGIAEVWWRVSDRVWTSADISYADANSEVSLYTKAAADIWRFDSGLVLALGAEAALDTAGLQSDDRHVRGGGLLNARFQSHDLSISGGITEAAETYATLTYGRRF